MSFLFTVRFASRVRLTFFLPIFSSFFFSHEIVSRVRVPKKKQVDVRHRVWLIRKIKFFFFQSGQWYWFFPYGGRSGVQYLTLSPLMM